MSNFDRDYLNRLLDDVAEKSKAFAEKIQPLFERNGWYYYNGVIPSISDIHNRILENIHSIRERGVNDQGFGCVSCGRIQVRVTNYQRLYVMVELVPEYYQAYDSSCP